MDIVIERAAPEDAEEILAYLRTVGGETDNLSFGSEGLPFTVEEEREFLQMQNTMHSAMFVAKRNGRIVGDASFSGTLRDRMRHRGSLSIAVLKAEWGKGIGAMLLEQIIAFARDTAHAEIISLEVRSDNERAIRLYQKFGFEKIGCFKGFFKINGQYVDFDLMNLYL